LDDIRTVVREEIERRFGIRPAVTIVDATPADPCDECGAGMLASDTVCTECGASYEHVDPADLDQGDGS
jgi:uncharacterized protein (DUF983 family)